MAHEQRSRPPSLADRFRAAAEVWEEFERFKRSFGSVPDPIRREFLRWLFTPSDPVNAAGNSIVTAFCAGSSRMRGLAIEWLCEDRADDIGRAVPIAAQKIGARRAQQVFSRTRSAWRSWCAERDNPAMAMRYHIAAHHAEEFELLPSA